MHRNDWRILKRGLIQRFRLAKVTMLLILVNAVLPALGQIRKLSTTRGIEFGIVGTKPAAPAPTLFIFASTIDGTLGDDSFNRMGMTLRRERGFLLVSMDLPSHGADRRQGEPAELDGWAFRLSHGENPIAPFLGKASSVLDYLVAEGYADPSQIAVSGTSRGGFIALHFTAADVRVKWVVAFAPVTELTALREFAGLQNHPGTRALALARVADHLANRPVWLCIGNNDNRVGTDHAIGFTRRVVESAVAGGLRPKITLRVEPSEGHSIPSDSHENAAKWVTSMQ